MENQSPSDLNEADLRWRADLENRGGLSRQEIEELEAHLRDSVLALQAHGLAAGEAFSIASRRLGSGRQLANEFAKVAPGRVWAERVFWMVVGVLLLSCLTRFAVAIRVMACDLALFLETDGHLIGAISGFIQWGVLATGVALCWRFVTRCQKAAARLGYWCLQRPVLLGGGIVLVFGWLQPWFGTLRMRVWNLLS